MYLASQAELAVRLVNTAVRAAGGTHSLGARAAFRGLVADRPFLAGPLTPEDADSLLMLRSELAQVFADAAGGSEEAAIDRINTLIATHPLHPVIARHGEPAWHFHLSEAGSVADRYAAAAVAGLTAVVIQLGADRLGMCAIAACDRVFIDLSSNRSRRYCAEHCTSRANLTAIPARHREPAGRRAATAAS